jgi:aldehyde:ferredoxin oxidoreductase
MYGGHGRILKVNLTTGEVTEDHYGEELFKTFMGGNGLAAKLVSEHVPSAADPLGPENAVLFTVGPLTSTPMWGTSRGHVAAISPLTGLFVDSNYGGDFPVAQKRTGFDAIFITGKASEPVYLSVTEEGGTIEEGAGLWGKTTEQTMIELEERAGKGAVCVSIGPAGEKGVLFANIIGGGKRPGASGRGGLGAVMGSKNLKAIVARGNRRTNMADRDALSRVLKDKYTALKGGTKIFSDYGTPILVNAINAQGMLGTRNNSREVFEHARDVSGELIRERYWQEDTACSGCPVGCGKNVRIPGGEYAGKAVKMPEYETIYALGSMMDNRDIESVLYGNHLCDLMGIDTITMGLTLAFAAECMEKGIASEGDLGGKVDFADGEGMVDLIRKTAGREGIGEHLAQGSYRLSKMFGKDARKYLYTVKGMEVAGHSARGLRGMSLSYPTSTRGGSHHDGRPNYPGADQGFEVQPRYILKNQCFTAVGDSLVVCRFVAERGIGTPLNEDMVKIVNAVTGWDTDLAGLERIGERIYNLERMINVHRGVGREADTLPYRVMHEPIPGGPAKGRYCSQEDLDAMLDAFYALRGWSQEGVPTREKLDELGLG